MDSFSHDNLRIEGKESCSREKMYIFQKWRALLVFGFLVPALSDEKSRKSEKI